MGDLIKNDMRWTGVIKEDAGDRVLWKLKIEWPTPNSLVKGRRSAEKNIELISYIGSSTVFESVILLFRDIYLPC